MRLFFLFISAGVKALFTLSVMGAAGKKLLDPIFYYVAKSRSHEAFLSIILSTVLLMSFVTQGTAYYYPVCSRCHSILSHRNQFCDVMCCVAVTHFD